MKDVAFHTCLGFLFTHELDAVPNHEWRLLPLLKTLPDETAMIVFIAAHVPLFAVLIGLVASPHEWVRESSRLGIAAFVFAHGLLHALLAGQESYEFPSALSSVLIYGGAAFGALYLLLGVRDRRVTSAA